MKIKFLIRLLVCLMVFGIVICAYRNGRNDVLISEFKECQANLLELTQWETNQPPELKEYVKARYYYLANRIPPKWLGAPCDYGPVGSNVVHLAVFKGPSSGQSEYLDFLQRNNLAKMDKK